MFKGFPSFVVVGVVVDMVASRAREVMRGVSGVRNAVVLCNVCLLSVLNVCMLRCDNYRKGSDNAQADKWILFIPSKSSAS